MWRGSASDQREFEFTRQIDNLEFQSSSASQSRKSRRRSSKDKPGRLSGEEKNLIAPCLGTGLSELRQRRSGPQAPVRCPRQLGVSSSLAQSVFLAHSQLSTFSPKHRHLTTPRHQR